MCRIPQRSLGFMDLNFAKIKRPLVLHPHTVLHTENLSCNKNTISKYIHTKSKCKFMPNPSIINYLLHYEQHGNCITWSRLIDITQWFWSLRSKSSTLCTYIHTSRCEDAKRWRLHRTAAAAVKLLTQSGATIVLTPTMQLSVVQFQFGVSTCRSVNRVVKTVIIVVFLY